MRNTADGECNAVQPIARGELGNQWATARRVRALDAVARTDRETAPPLAAGRAVFGRDPREERRAQRRSRTLSGGSQGSGAVPISSVQFLTLRVALGMESSKDRRDACE